MPLATSRGERNHEMCSPIDIGSCAQQAVQSALGEGVQNLANAVLEMFGAAVASLGTIWLAIGTPNLTAGGAASPISAGSAAPGSEGIVTALSYAMWIALVMAAVSTIWLGMLIAASVRRGEGALNVGRLGLVLAGAVIVASAGALITGLLPAAPQVKGGAALFLQSALWWYMGALAVLSVILAGVRMAWETRAEPGKDLLKSLVTLIVVAGAGVVFVQLFIAAGDAFSLWVLKGSLQCDVAADTACFGKNIAVLLSLTASNGLGAMLIIVLGFIASIAAFFQIVLMIARSGMLVILAGILPLSAAAAATNTDMGRAWWKKSVAWLVAFLLYKPAAAVVYATAFQLVGSNVFKDDDALVAVLTGLMLMILAVVAMVALMRFVTPLVSATTGGGGGAGASAGAAVATGAMQAGQLMGGGANSGGGASSPSGAASTGASSTGATGGGAGQGGAPDGSAAGASGSTAAGATGSPAGSDGASGSEGGAGPQGASGDTAGVGGSAQSAQSAGAASGAGATGAAGGASGGAAAGGAAGGAAAAAGPAGMAAAVGAQKVGEAAGSAAAAARGVAQSSTGEGEGP